MNTYLRILLYSGKVRSFLLPFLLTSFLAALFGVLNLVLIKPILDVLFGINNSAESEGFFGLYTNLLLDLIQDGQKLPALQVVCLTLFASILLSNIFRYLSLRLMEIFKANMVKKLRQDLFEKILYMPISFFQAEKKGNLMSRITTDIQEIENSVANTFSTGIKELLLLIGYLTALFWISVQLTLFALIVFPITGIFLGVVQKRLKKDAGFAQGHLSEMLSIMDEVFGGIANVKAFVTESFFAKKFHLANTNYRKRILKYAFRKELSNPFSEVIGVSMVAVLLLYGGSLIFSDQSSLDASTFMAYIALFSQIVRPAKEIAQAFSGAQRGLAAGQRVLQLLDTPSTLSETQESRNSIAFNQKLEFASVDFSYDGNTAVLKNISFCLEKGQTLALVGPSGGGKSTIADLLIRFYDPTSGQISLDNTPISNIKQAVYRNLFGMVSQEAFLIHDSILENVRLGRDFTEEEVLEAIKVAYAEEFVSKLPDGVHTTVGDKGTRLSGGQKQRISIARAVLHNPAILILDEATSALDTESEKMVQQALVDLMKSRTSLIIAHRLSTISHADEILVIENGTIVERGTHANLLQNNEGTYSKLVAMQAFS